MFADDVDQVVVPILMLRALRRKTEASPIRGVVPRLGPAAFASGVVVEGDNERLSAVVCLEHQLMWLKASMGDSTAAMRSAFAKFPTVNHALSLFPRHGRNAD